MTWLEYAERWVKGEMEESRLQGKDGKGRRKDDEKEKTETAEDQHKQERAEAMRLHLRLLATIRRVITAVGDCPSDQVLTKLRSASTLRAVG